ncbi:hypothetical protein AURANDRAFT_64369 [Aureococcus anophagefferens]|uniref:Uncharacterized protein n=1 Tax=Aureococcus anophagefferens TaxID=44056 RepID=F0Y9X5_AURAN|nr:hypothetical protein AURANDRAFT_64369 [Aureococcus anophagefferens]EGB07831.1 hypothetical protein AURANDRAFT_64369 [Aureococcus anophagefferens]|eukprot:XP_009037211.1 hypothetical protein AURANDRAFT_64369 [Aureococcus anophagefferens]
MSAGLVPHPQFGPGWFLFDGRPVVLFPGTENPGVEAGPPGEAGLAYQERDGALFVLSLRAGVGVESKLWSLALDGWAPAIDALARVFAEREVGRLAGVAGPAPAYVACVASEAATRVIVAMCEAAATATRGTAVAAGALSTGGEFVVPAIGASKAAERRHFADLTIVADPDATLAAIGDRPVALVADVLRSGGALDDGERALRAAAARAEASLGLGEVKKLALFRRVSAFHGTVTTREIEPGLRAFERIVGAKLGTPGRAANSDVAVVYKFTVRFKGRVYYYYGSTIASKESLEKKKAEVMAALRAGDRAALEALGVFFAAKRQSAHRRRLHSKTRRHSKKIMELFEQVWASEDADASIELEMVAMIFGKKDDSRESFKLFGQFPAEQLFVDYAFRTHGEDYVVNTDKNCGASFFRDSATFRRKRARAIVERLRAFKAQDPAGYEVYGAILGALLASCECILVDDGKVRVAADAAPLLEGGVAPMDVDDAASAEGGDGSEEDGDGDDVAGGFSVPDAFQDEDDDGVDGWDALFGDDFAFDVGVDEGLGGAGEDAMSGVFVDHAEGVRELRAFEAVAKTSLAQRALCAVLKRLDLGDAALPQLELGGGGDGGASEEAAAVFREPFDGDAAGDAAAALRDLVDEHGPNAFAPAAAAEAPAADVSPADAPPDEEATARRDGSDGEFVESAAGDGESASGDGPPAAPGDGAVEHTSARTRYSLVEDLRLTHARRIGGDASVVVAAVAAALLPGRSPRALAVRLRSRVDLRVVRLARVVHEDLGAARDFRAERDAVQALAPVAPRRRVAACASWRTGDWLDAETEFAEKVIQYFRLGWLPNCENGASLRALLAELLHCNPTRITSKLLRGDDALGKTAFTTLGEIDADACAQFRATELAFPVDGVLYGTVIPADAVEGEIVMIPSSALTRLPDPAAA